MTRPLHRPFANPTSRRVPPLPHPSWSRAATEHNAPAAPIGPDEFWNRLGL